MKFMQVAFWSMLQVHTSSSDLFKRRKPMFADASIEANSGLDLQHLTLSARELEKQWSQSALYGRGRVEDRCGMAPRISKLPNLDAFCLLHDSVCTAPQPNGMKIHKQLPAGQPSTSLPKTDQHQLGKTAWSTWTSTEHSHNSYYTYFSLRALGFLQWIVGELAAGTKHLSVRTCPLTTTAQHLPSGDRSVNNHTKHLPSWRSHLYLEHGFYYQDRTHIGAQYLPSGKDPQTTSQPTI